jgi:RHS repeat-associated protein
MQGKEVAILIGGAMLIGLFFITTPEPKVGEAVNVLDEEASNKIFYFENAIIENDQIKYLSKDYLGNIRVISSEISAVFDFTPFGASNTNTFLSKKISQGSGLANFEAREYDQTLGRFYVPDPIMTESLSPYNYALNNPLKLTDSNGMFPTFTEGMVEQIQNYIDQKKQEQENHAISLGIISPEVEEVAEEEKLTIQKRIEVKKKPKAKYDGPLASLVNTVVDLKAVSDELTRRAKEKLDQNNIYLDPDGNTKKAIVEIPFTDTITLHVGAVSIEKGSSVRLSEVNTGGKTEDNTEGIIIGFEREFDSGKIVVLGITGQNPFAAVGMEFKY